MICVPGELWLGLEKLHQLTSEDNYSLRITMKDFDDKTYVAVYDQFQVLWWYFYQIGVVCVSVCHNSSEA